MIPPKGVHTPLAALTADRPMEAVTAIEPTNDPTNWQEPNARISWEMSTDFPAAENKKKHFWKKVVRHCGIQCFRLHLGGTTALNTGNTRWGSITVPLTSCLTGLD
jgi:hypothetical protein